MNGTLGANQADEHQHHADELADNGGNGHTGNAQVEHNHQHQVQNHIDDPCHGQVVQGTAGIAHGAENGCAEGVQHVEGHAGKVDADVQGGLVNHILRAAHHFQQRATEDNADNAYHHAADGCHGHGGMHTILHVLHVACAVVPGNDHAGAYAQPQEDVNQQVDQGTGGAYGRQCRCAGKAADYHHVCRIIKQLQNAGQHQRTGKSKHLGQQGACGHVHFILGSLCTFHVDTPYTTRLVR